MVTEVKGSPNHESQIQKNYHNHSHTKREKKKEFYDFVKNRLFILIFRLQTMRVSVPALKPLCCTSSIATPLLTVPALKLLVYIKYFYNCISFPSYSHTSVVRIVYLKYTFESTF